jgi:hypothetical protein
VDVLVGGEEGVCNSAALEAGYTGHEKGLSLEWGMTLV